MIPLTHHNLVSLVVALLVPLTLGSVPALAVDEITPPPPKLATKDKPYKPKFFRPHEFESLRVLAETILRDDEVPGVREARANEFIDFQIAYDPEIQQRFRNGLRWLDGHAQQLYGRVFIKLKPEQRRDIIQCLEIKALHRPGEERGREFFELARRYTYMGFYASEEALKVAIPPAAGKGEPKRQRLAGAGATEVENAD